MKCNLDPFFIFLVFGPLFSVIPILFSLSINLSIASIVGLSFITYIFGLIPALITANFAQKIFDYPTIKYVCLCTIFGTLASVGCIAFLRLFGNDLHDFFDELILIASISGAFASLMCSLMSKFLSK